MAKELRALRGATTLESDTFENMKERVKELLDSLVAENDIEQESIINIFFSATPDISSSFPATAARNACPWLENIALFGSQELAIPTDQPMCIRVLIQFYKNAKGELKNVYLHNAKNLRSPN